MIYYESCLDYKLMNLVLLYVMSFVLCLPYHALHFKIFFGIFEILVLFRHDQFGIWQNSYFLIKKFHMKTFE